MSPKTHLESDSNFENFLQKYDRGKNDSHESELNRSRVLERISSDKPKIPKSRPKSKNALDFKNLNDDSDLQFSTDRSREYGHVKGSLSNLPTAHQKSSQGLFGAQQAKEDLSRLAKVKDEYKLVTKLNSSYDMSKAQDIKIVSRGGNDSDKKSILMDLDTLFSHRRKTNEHDLDKQVELPTPIKHKASPRDGRETSLKNSIVMFEQELQSIRSKALGNGETNWRSPRNLENSIGNRESFAENGQASSSRLTDLFIVKSPRQGKSTQGNKSSRSKYFMSPLTIQKFCKLVQRVFQRCVLKKLSIIVESKRETNNLALLMLADCIGGARKKRARDFILSLQELPLRAKRAQACLNILNSLITQKIRSQKQACFTDVVSAWLEATNPRFSSLLDNYSASSTPITGAQLIKIADVDQRRLEALARILKRKHRIMEQEAKHAFQVLSQDSEHITEVALARGSRKLGGLIAHRQASDLLRGYYGIKAAGGRLHKLFILLLKNQKIYTAQTKYCVRKLRIWNKFKANISQDYGNVKTIIVRTSDPMEEQRNVTFKRMFFRKALDSLAKIFKNAVDTSRQNCLDTIRSKSFKSEGQENLMRILHDSIHVKILRQGWIELSIFDLQRKTVQRATSAKKEIGYLSPGKMVRGGQGGKAVQNPMFRYFESRQQENGEAIGQDQSKEKMSIDLEILRSGLDLDDKIQKMSASKELHGARHLEHALKADSRFSSAPEIVKLSATRGLVIILQKVYRSRVKNMFHALRVSNTTHELDKVKIHYIKFGLEKTERLLKRAILKTKYESLLKLCQLPSRPKPSRIQAPPFKPREASKKLITPSLVDLRKTVNIGLSRRSPY